MRRDEVTERMKALMSQPDQESLFGIQHAPSTHNARQQEEDTGPGYIYNAEKKEHELLECFLNQKEWFYRHDRMDKRTRSAKGLPDFIVGVYGQLVCIEFKLYGRKLTREQELWRDRALKSRCPYYVYDNAGEAITMLLSMERQLCLNAP